MEKLEKDFMMLTQYVAMGERKLENNWDSSDWEALYKLCSINKMIANTYDLVKELSGLPEDLRLSWDRYRFRTFVRQKKCFYSLKELINDLNNNGILYAVFKGNIIADLYADPYYRISADSDIYVEEADREAVTGIILRHGYEYVEEESKSTFVSVFYKAEAKHKIELHTSLFEDYKGKQIEILNGFKLTDVSKRVQLNIDGLDLWTLGHEEHLIYQVFHFVKHFILEGISIRYLIDITKFINRYYEEIEWNDFWKKMKALNYDVFCQKFFLICEKYYDLNPKVLEGKNVTLDMQVEELLLIDFMHKGNFNGNVELRWQLLGDMKGYLEGSKSEIAEELLYKRRSYYFPSQEELNDNYMYAKKHKILLPVAWIHRVINRIKLELSNTEAYSVKQKSDVIHEREQLYASIGLLKDNSEKNKG